MCLSVYRSFAFVDRSRDVQVTHWKAHHKRVCAALQEVAALQSTSKGSDAADDVG